MTETEAEHGSQKSHSRRLHHTALHPSQIAFQSHGIDIKRGAAWPQLGDLATIPAQAGRPAPGAAAAAVVRVDEWLEWLLKSFRDRCGRQL